LAVMRAGREAEERYVEMSERCELPKGYWLRRVKLAYRVNLTPVELMQSYVCKCSLMHSESLNYVWVIVCVIVPIVVLVMKLS
jgi:hypothetical protein